MAGAWEGEGRAGRHGAKKSSGVRSHKDSWPRKRTDCSPSSVESTGGRVRRAKGPRRMYYAPDSTHRGLTRKIADLVDMAPTLEPPTPAQTSEAQHAPVKAPFRVRISAACICFPLRNPQTFFMPERKTEFPHDDMYTSRWGSRTPGFCMALFAWYLTMKLCDKSWWQPVGRRWSI